MAHRFNPKRLQRARKTAGLGADQVGQALGRSESLVWMVESGHRIPPPELLADWCRGPRLQHRLRLHRRRGGAGMSSDAREAGAREADRLGPIRDPDVLARVARILRPLATNAGHGTRRPSKTGDATSDASRQ